MDLIRWTISSWGVSFLNFIQLKLVHFQCGYMCSGIVLLQNRIQDCTLVRNNIWFYNSLDVTMCDDKQCWGPKVINNGTAYNSSNNVANIPFNKKLLTSSTTIHFSVVSRPTDSSCPSWHLPQYLDFWAPLRIFMKRKSSFSLPNNSLSVGIVITCQKCLTSHCTKFQCLLWL